MSYNPVPTAPVAAGPARKPSWTERYDSVEYELPLPPLSHQTNTQYPQERERESTEHDRMLPPPSPDSYPSSPDASGGSAQVQATRTTGVGRRFSLVPHPTTTTSVVGPSPSSSSLPSSASASVSRGQHPISTSTSQPLPTTAGGTNEGSMNSRKSFHSSPLNPYPYHASHPPSTSASTPTLAPAPQTPTRPVSALNPSSTSPVSAYGSYGYGGRPGSRASFATLGSPLAGGRGLGISHAPGTSTPTSDLLAAHNTHFGLNALGGMNPGSRGSMILYKRVESGVFSPGIGTGGSTTPVQVQVPSHTGVSVGSGMSDDALLPPPPLFSAGSGSGSGGGSVGNRASVYSVSGDSLYGTERGLVAYAYDPDEDSSDEEEDWLHDPEVAYPGSRKAKVLAEVKAAAAVGAKAGDGKGKAKGKGKTGGVGVDPATGKRITDPTHPLYIPQPYIAPRLSWRGLVNIGTLIALVASLLCLFVVYPMVRFFADEGVNARITGNLRINSTGQAEFLPGELDVGGVVSGTGTSSAPRPTSTRRINQPGVIHDRRSNDGVASSFDMRLNVDEDPLESREREWWSVRVRVMSPLGGDDGDLERPHQHQHQQQQEEGEEGES